MENENIKKYKQIVAVKEIRVGTELKKVWTRIGTAFENKDGSFKLVFNFFPVEKEIDILIRDEFKKEEIKNE